MNRFLILLFASCMFCSCNEQITAPESTNNTIKTRTLATDFSFDEVTKPDVWETFNTVDEMKAACQIPDNLLSSLSTEKLVELCANYPLYGNYILYNDEAEGIKSVMSGFNGFSELQKRTDAAEAITNYIRQYNPVQTISEEGTSTPILKMGYLSKIIEYGEFPSQDLEECQSVLQEKSMQLTDYADTGISLTATNDEPVYTYYGKAIKTLTLTEFSNDEITEITNYVSTTYPRALILLPASRIYNCHSYAWNVLNGGRRCWINATISTKNDNISKYWTNDYYSSTDASDKKMKKIFYYNSDHSATLSDGSGMYISKWGSGPLVRHAPEYGPYEHMDQRSYFKGESCAYGTLDNSEPGTISVGGTVVYGISSKNPPFLPTAFSVKGEWIVINAKGNDVSSESYISITKNGNTSASITFNKAGVYEIYYNVYNLSGTQLLQYRTDTYVEL